MRIAWIIAAVVLSTAAVHGQARADASRALTAAKAGLPADARILVGVDFAAIQKTQLFATYYPKLHDKPDAAKVLDALKDGCKLDPLVIIQGLVVATAGDGEDGAMYVAVQGVDRAKLATCLQAAAKTDDKSAKVEVKNAGNITEVTKGSDTAFFGWAGKDVVVVAFHANDKPSLVKWMGGKGALAKSELGKTLAKVNTAATIWGAAAEPKEIQPGMTARGGYGTVSYAKGNVAADVHAVMETAAQASSMSTMANQQLDEARKGSLPPEFATLLKAVTVAVEKDEVRIKANVAEKDLLGAIASAMAIFGGP
jgi:hypothetical protein